MARPEEANLPAITVRPLRRDDWPVLEELFGANGACGGCWCMWPRVPKGGKLWEECKGDKNRADFRRLVEAGAVHGVLAFAEGKSVGWCSFGPRSTFPRLERVRAIQRSWDEGTWSVVCFYIPARWRGKGVAGRLLAAATERAFALGARELEGYPAVPRDADTPIPAAFAWTGVPALFEAAGYHKLPGQEASRAIFLLDHPPPPPAKRPARRKS
jgi:GNAT superfamily N-acetyltransferase